MTEESTAPETRVRDSFARQSMMVTLGAALEHVAPGEVRIAAPIADHLLQQQGAAHAALAFAIGDSAAGYAALTLMPAGTEVVTAEIKINLLAPAIGTRLIAQGRVLRAGRRLVTVAADIWAETDRSTEPPRHVATMLGTMVAVSG